MTCRLFLWKGAGRTRQNFFILCKKKLSTRVVFCPTLPNFKEAATKSRQPSLSGDELFCLFGVTKSISTFNTPLCSNRYGIILIQKRSKLKSTSVQKAWGERISFAFHTKISIFRGFKGKLVLGHTCHWLTDEQEPAEIEREFI